MYILCTFVVSVDIFEPVRFVYEEVFLVAQHKVNKYYIFIYPQFFEKQESVRAYFEYKPCALVVFLEKNKNFRRKIRWKIILVLIERREADGKVYFMINIMYIDCVCQYFLAM